MLKKTAVFIELCKIAVKAERSMLNDAFGINLSASCFSKKASSVNRNSNDHNGPLRINANWNFENFDNTNDNLGRVLANDSILANQKKFSFGSQRHHECL